MTRKIQVCHGGLKFNVCQESKRPPQKKQKKKINNRDMKGRMTNTPHSGNNVSEHFRKKIANGEERGTDKKVSKGDVKKVERLKGERR